MTPEGTGYNFTGNGYNIVATNARTGYSKPSWDNTNTYFEGFTKDSNFTEYGRIPYLGGGNDAMYECDYFWYLTTNVNIAQAGGRCTGGTYYGLHCLDLHCSASYADWSVGASLSFINPN